MKQIPETENALVLRTEFSNQAAWESICLIIREPVSEWHFLANVEFVNDKEYAGITKDQLIGLIPKHYKHTFMIVVDQTAIVHPDASFALSPQRYRELKITYPLQIWTSRNSLRLLMKMEFFVASPEAKTGQFASGLDTTSERNTAKHANTWTKPHDPDCLEYRAIARFLW
jgi:hypothetical protein